LTAIGELVLKKKDMGVTSLHNERELLRKTAESDQRAFKILYDTFSPKVYTQAFHLLHSVQLAEEMVQEVFFKIWRMRSDLMNINNLDAYLKTTTRNRCLNVIRHLLSDERADKAVTSNYVEAHNETEEAIILNDTRNIISQAIDLLPAQQREVYRLCHQEGLKYEEVAVKLNISVNTVQTHMSRALKFLRHHLKNNSDIAAILIIMKLF